MCHRGQRAASGIARARPADRLGNLRLLQTKQQLGRPLGVGGGGKDEPPIVSEDLELGRAKLAQQLSACIAFVAPSGSWGIVGRDMAASSEFGLF